jgi:ABC-type enterochelin transport system ATPase subunit
MFKELQRVSLEFGGGSGLAFVEYFIESLSALLTWQVPNRFVIDYRGKELKHHSLGQRASALILFVLSQEENDLILIDQPEDDLDNQTIYEDVIKLIRSLKPKTQFIFATHNANFPVLGDAEQILSSKYSDDSIAVISGSIDKPQLQQEIVDIMEGGEEAFRQRKRIYDIWKPRSS